MSLVARFRLDPRGVFIHPHGDARALIRRGVAKLGNEWRQAYGLNVRWDFAHPAGVPVVSSEVIIKGQHYLGKASRTRITLHSGWVSAWGRYSERLWAKDPDSFADQVAQILWHEWGHTQGLRFPEPDRAHSNHPTDLMSSNAPRTLVDTRDHFRRLFGVIGQRAPEAEPVPATGISAHCFSVAP